MMDAVRSWREIIYFLSNQQNSNGIWKNRTYGLRDIPLQQRSTSPSPEALDFVQFQRSEVE